MYHVPDIVQSKVWLPVAGISHPLLFGSKGLKTGVLAPVVVHLLRLVVEKVAEPIQDEMEVVRVLAGLQHRVEQLLVARAPNFFCVTATLSVRASQAARPFSAPSSGRLPSNAFATLLAEPDVVRNKTRQRSWFAGVHVYSSTTLGVAVSAMHRVDNGRGLP